ncbi:MAG: glycosyltransferase family 2 protein [Candidatus Omnitrophota bacterium]|nr:glycosyltransferase family 2 protein [Candidatus Omnitrophota bacterium]
MLEGKKIIVVMPAYNAELTLEQTYRDIPKGLVDEVLVVDDHSRDKTVEVCRRLGLQVFVHEDNKGYGANQKTCYREALRRGADVVIMLHPDYQYPPRLITAMAGLVVSGMFDIVLGSRILGGMSLKGGMPLYKYISNRFLTLFENIITGAQLSEYHTGYRAFSREVLLRLPLLENSDDFIFDNQILVQAIRFNYRIGELTAPSRYTKESSSISLKRSIVYGLGVIVTALSLLLEKSNLIKFRIFNPNGRKIDLTI